jgi:hypothetical protein
MAVDEVVTPSGRGAPYQIAASRKGEGNYDPKVLGMRDKKSQLRTKWVPVLKPTQVGVKKILRRSRERS